MDQLIFVLLLILSTANQRVSSVNVAHNVDLYCQAYGLAVDAEMDDIAYSIEDAAQDFIDVHISDSDFADFCDL